MLGFGFTLMVLAIIFIIAILVVPKSHTSDNRFLALGVLVLCFLIGLYFVLTS